MHCCQSFPESGCRGLCSSNQKNGDVCRAKLGSKLVNLKRHIERHHPDIFKSILLKKNKQRSSSCSKSQYKQATDAFKILSEWKNYCVNGKRKIQTPSYSTGCGEWNASKALLFTWLFRFAWRNDWKTWCFITKHQKSDSVRSWRTN